MDYSISVTAVDIGAGSAELETSAILLDMESSSAESETSAVFLTQ